MGRSRAVAQSAPPDLNQRGKRKRTTSGAEAAESSSAAQKGLAQELSEPKGAFYHCNYCQKDISGKVRIKCGVCPDFDLCIECFSVGAEVTPHKCNHPYRVMDNLSFPLICPDWNADEEMLLLEGIEMYGFGNWTEVSEHVGTRRRQQCIDHYNAIYMNSPCFPLPDMSRVMGKSREDLLALSKGSGEIKKELPMFMEITIKEESPFSPGFKSEEPKKPAASKASSHSTAGKATNIDGASGAGKKGSHKLHIKDEPKVTKLEESQRTIGVKNLRSLVEEGPSVTELSGYNHKRQEFEIEYDNDAEQILADMEFHDTDTDGDRELKLRVLHVYGKRLDERKRRKDFVLERNLIRPDPLEKTLSPEVREIYQRFKVFMRFHSNDDHKEFIKSIIEEQQIVKRILDLQEARAAGCKTAAEASKYLEQKRRNESEETLLKIKENAQAGTSGKVLQQISPRGVGRGSAILHPGPSKDLSLSTQAPTSYIDDWDISGLMGADLLSETEKRLCCELRILPSHYLRMLQTISTEILSGNVKKKSDAHSLFKVDPNKVDRVYDMVIRKGLTLA
ncbi:transcriptional adapter ADA2-like isoform X2 [Argentina anserina]|uniref:transcriptional adapter ADA2-like isoform X2 n=1 Tax=Argentina anserina TaxID=57926 RepID=UPI00217635D0|nr:transcriptional adapter ADA2-like isoform X2 [Potentilla anserina]